MVTIKQIADAVGVSATTVSRVLNFDASLSISAPKRQAVIEMAEALNYATPRARRASPAMGKIALVHFLEPGQELGDPYYVSLRLGIERRCQALKIEVFKVYHTESLPDGPLLQSASGVIAVGQHTNAEVAYLAAQSRNLVFADFTPASGEHDSVESDLRGATRRLLDDLASLGYRRIGFIGWNDTRNGFTAPFGEKRCSTFVEWSREHGGFDPALCLTARNTEESGYRLTKEIMAAPKRPDMLVASNDNMAIGAYRALSELGLSVPRDIGVASFNDTTVAQFMSPPLSTVRLPAEEIGRTAVDLMVERAKGRDLGKRVVLAARTVWRGSTRSFSN